jgi:GNAT superfamily N-acetyltransferase
MTQADAPGGTPGPSWRVRPARSADASVIHELVLALARYEREPDAVQATVADFQSALFGPSPLVHCQVAEIDDPQLGPTVVGIALWYVTFSTWRGRHGLWLEDLFVLPEYRRFGLGRALLAALAQLCLDRGYPRFEWWVLDWNEPAHGFYRSLGAAPQDEWTVWRLEGDRLGMLATGGDPTAERGRPPA